MQSSYQVQGDPGGHGIVEVEKKGITYNLFFNHKSSFFFSLFFFFLLFVFFNDHNLINVSCKSILHCIRYICAYESHW